MKITKRQLLGLIQEALSQDAFPADPYLSAAMHIYKVGKFDDH